MPFATSPAENRSDLSTSGDLLADRRFVYARDLLKEGDGEAAADLMLQVIERVPRWAPAWLGLGDAEWLAGRQPEAVAAWKRCLELDSGDLLGAHPRLARAGAEDVGDALGHGYIAALFDDYASRFDSHLIGTLHYRAPQLLADAILSRAGPFARAYDLGCGTGLMAAALRGHVGFMAGCDLSPAMVAEAGAKALYDKLVCQDVVAALQAEPPESFDLVMAADVFVYIGDLQPVLTASQHALTRGGLMAFTAQSTSGDGIQIGEDLRAAHPETLLRAWASGAGLSVLQLDAVSVRQDRGQPVPGWLCLLQKD